MAYFTTGEIRTREGERFAIGKLTLGTKHAPMDLGARAASEHYEHTGYVAADVACWPDKFGIWVTGALRPNLTEGQVRAIRAAAISGDWRRIGGRYRLIAGLMVNVPGFPIPRMKTYVHDGVQTALVASGLVRVHRQRHVPTAVVDRIARSIGRDRDARTKEQLQKLRSRVHTV
jgi:hypothetical protein